MLPRSTGCGGYLYERSGYHQEGEGVWGEIDFIDNHIPDMVCHLDLDMQSDG